MGPPPGAAASPSSGPGPTSTDVVEKYRTLKRRFIELEEESNLETHLSGERNVRMREERDHLLQKIQEMEQNGQTNTNSSLKLTAALSAGFLSSSVSLQTLPNSNTNDRADLVLASKNSGLQGGRQEEEGRKQHEGEDMNESGFKRVSTGGGNVVNSSHLLKSTTPDASGTTTSDDRIPPSSPKNGSNSRVRHSPLRLSPQNPSTQLASNGDVEMANVQGSSHNHPRNSSNQRRREQVDRVNGSSHTTRKVPEPSPRRSTRQTRSGRSDGTVIAALAAAAAEATAAPQPSQTSVPMSAGTNTAPIAHENMHANTDPPKLLATPSSTLAHALGPSTESTSTAPVSVQHMQHAPSIESILKVAEAVASMNAAKLNEANSNANSNLDPHILAVSKASSVTSTANKLPGVNTNLPIMTNNNASASSSTSTPASGSPTPTSSLSSNPYLSLSTNLLPRANPGSTTPTGHPMLMPYLFYPHGAPITSNSSTYPVPYNPYYYLAAPMVPGPNGMYPQPPPPANFAPSAQQRPPPEPPKTKPKRLKAHTVTTKSFSIPMVPRDKKGKPMLPLNVGIMTVISLGEVCIREHFHTERYIFPVGYEVTRRYLSTIDPTVEVVYHCTILDGGDGPKFQIIPSDRPDKPIIAGTATGAWSNIVKQANAIRNRQHSNSVSGPDFFGLGQNTIKHLIQELPTADRLRDYVWQNFVEGGPLGGRHAAVIPALPEEYDASMPIGAYYPKRDPNENPNVPRGMSHYPQHIIAQAEAERAQKLAAQSQEQVVAGSSLSANMAQASVLPPNLQPVPIAGPPMIASGGLDFHEYQPSRAQHATPAAAEKQGIMNSSTATSSSTSSSGRRSGFQGTPQQQQQTLPQQNAGVVNDTTSPSIGADGTMPTTFAEIMNAYPIPGVAATADATSASTS